MKIEAKVRNAFTDSTKDEVTPVNVDMDYVEADVDEVRCYVIDELEAMMCKRNAQVNYGFVIENLDDIIAKLEKMQKA